MLGILVVTHELLGTLLVRKQTYQEIRCDAKKRSEAIEMSE